MSRSSRYRCVSCCSGLASLAALLWSADVLGTPQLTWNAPAECPQGPAVLELVRDIVGEKVWREATLQASGSIVATANGYRLELRTQGASGGQVRSLDAKVCRDLLGASAVVLGLNLKGAANEEATDSSEGTPASPGEGGQPASGAVGAGEPPTSGEPGKTSAPPSQTPPKSAPAAPKSITPESNGEGTDADSDESRFWLGLPVVAVGVGSLPQVTWSGGLTFGVRFSEWSTWLSARYQLPQLLTPDWSSEVGAKVARYTAEVGVVRVWTTGAVEGGPLLLLGADYLTASGAGEDVIAATAGSVVASVGLGVIGRVSLGSLLSLSGTLCGEIPLSRPRFVVASLGEVGQLGAVQGRFMVATEWKF